MHQKSCEGKLPQSDAKPKLTRHRFVTIYQHTIRHAMKKIEENRGVASVIRGVYSTSALKKSPRKSFIPLSHSWLYINILLLLLIYKPWSH